MRDSHSLVTQSNAYTSKRVLRQAFPFLRATANPRFRIIVSGKTLLKGYVRPVARRALKVQSDRPAVESSSAPSPAS